MINADGTSPDSKVRVSIIDFGCARRFVDREGLIIPPRENVGFRGTVRYASICSLKEEEIGPHDDLWSVFYS